jgi:hypothetical protein
MIIFSLASVIAIISDLLKGRTAESIFFSSKGERGEIKWEVI